MPDFLLPDLGEGLTEATITGWHVRVGDTVSIDQTVVDVETAKAVVEVPVPFAGRVTALHGAAGDELTVGSPLITVATVDEPVTIDDADDSSGAVLIGYGTSSTGRRRRHRRARQTDLAAEQVDTPVEARPEVVAVVSPLVRRLARAAGLELAALGGSGPQGLITRRDVDRAIAAAASEGQADASDDGADADADADAAVVRIPIRGLRKTVADKLSRSRREIPEATVWVDVDATGLLDLRHALNADPDAPRIGLLAVLGRLAVLGLRRYPELNARIVGDEIVIGPAVNLGFAAQTDRGLVVPVIHGAQEQTTEELAQSFSGLTQRARDGALGPRDMTGGTFTINNYGVFGVDGSAAIINHPEVAILGIGRIMPRPWVVDGEITARPITELTLAFDHRACDGGVAGGFLRFVADCIESPAQVIRHL